MLTTRRVLLSVVAAGAALPSVPAFAQDVVRAERAVGNADAKTTVVEYFSLTCSHCAAFAKETMPQVKSELIETGKIRWVYKDFPLNQVDLIAFSVTRYLPVERYAAFVEALLSTQDRWAFARGIDPVEELWKMAALAGMSRATFDKAKADEALFKWILSEQQDAQKKYGVDSTPTFVVNNEVQKGHLTFDRLKKLIPGA